jgi:LuxR family maltose regulon positive regulatory protein
MDAVKNAAQALSRLRQARQDVKGALAAIQDAEDALDDPLPPLARAGLLALRARILVRQGSLPEAAQCAEQAVRLAGRDRGQVGQMAALAACRVLLAQRTPDEAIPQLTESLAAAEKCSRLGVVIELLILRSLAHARQGEPQEAQADLGRSLTLAMPEGYVRIFLDEGQPMQMLLAQWLAGTGAGPLRDYAISLLSQFAAELPGIDAAQGKASLPGDLVEPLTPREQDVLRLLAQGFSNRQIAEKLILSEGTVKFYVHTVMEKLGVRSRTQAIVKAREINLLDVD